MCTSSAGVGLAISDSRWFSVTLSGYHLSDVVTASGSPCDECVHVIAHLHVDTRVLVSVATALAAEVSVKSKRHQLRSLALLARSAARLSLLGNHDPHHPGFRDIGSAGVVALADRSDN